MTTKPNYILESWPHGWLLCAATQGGGVPMEAINTLTRVAGKAGIYPGIAHHYKTSRRQTILCAATAAGAKLWMEDIEKSLEGLSPQMKWWRGMDVGLSSAAIFAVLCEGEMKFCGAADMGQGNTPRDADDFGRCLRLVETMGWRERLAEVATAYPETDWPKIIGRWDELAKATPEQQSLILHSL